MGQGGRGQLHEMRGRGARRWVRTTLVVGTLALAALVVGCSSSSEDGSVPPVAGVGSSVPGDLGTGAAGTSPSSLLTLTSGAFADGEAIPLRHACVNQGGENSSPPLAWSGVPDDTTRLVLVVHDPDAVLPGGFTHLVTAVPTDLSSVDDGASLTGEGPMARWIGPCPPSGEHHYVFTLYAFGPDVTLPEHPDKVEVDEVSAKALAVAELTGLFANQG